MMGKFMATSYEAGLRCDGSFHCMYVRLMDILKLQHRS